MYIQTLGVTSLRLGEHDLDIRAAELTVEHDHLIGWSIAVVLESMGWVDPDTYEATFVTTDGIERSGTVIVTHSNGEALSLLGSGPISPMP